MATGGERPKTRYAKTAFGRIAYQIVGDGPIAAVALGDLELAVDEMWHEPRLVRCLERLSTFCSLIWFDYRGQGASDPMPDVDSRLIENIGDDVIALLDVLGIERAALVDLLSGDMVGLTVAATHPERISALVLRHPMARMRWAPDYPQGWPEDGVATFLAAQEETWGTDEGARSIAGSASSDERFIEWLARSERASFSPASAARRLRAASHVDARAVLPTITVPTLVMTSGGRSSTPRSRYVAEHIPGAREVELPGEHLFFTGDPGPMLDAIEEFLTGKLSAPDIDRVLATVLFTDVVGSTERATSLGDRRWRELLDAHHALIRRELERHRGRLVKTTGDGVLATFDGPGRAIRAATAITESVRSLGVEVRAGLHTGEVELMGDDIGGIAVHIGQRVSALAGPGEVLVTRTVTDLVAGSGLQFEDHGEHELKGVPGSWKLFAVTA